MCEWGTDVVLRVPIPAELSYTGEFRWDDKPVDACLAPIVAALNDAGIYTSNCCCGHGKGAGNILLHDGRVLIIGETDVYLRWLRSGSPGSRAGLVGVGTTDTLFDTRVRTRYPSW